MQDDDQIKFKMYLFVSHQENRLTQCLLLVFEIYYFKAEKLFVAKILCHHLALALVLLLLL